VTYLTFFFSLLFAFCPGWKAVNYMRFKHQGWRQRDWDKRGKGRGYLWGQKRGRGRSKDACTSCSISNSSSTFYSTFKRYNLFLKNLNTSMWILFLFLAFFFGGGGHQIFLIWVFNKIIWVAIDFSNGRVCEKILMNNLVHDLWAGGQSQLVCSGCRNLLLYPAGATSVCCAVCNAVTAVPPPGN